MGFGQRIIDFSLVLIFLFVYFSLPASAQEPIKNRQYASATLVIYNQNVANSRKLAAYYAGKRNIPFENLIGLKCSAEEIILGPNIKGRYRNHSANNLMLMVGGKEKKMPKETCGPFI